MKRWALGGAIAAVVAVAVVTLAVAGVVPLRSADNRRSATSVASLPAPATARTSAAPASAAPVDAPWAAPTTAVADEVASITPVVTLKAPIAVRARKPFVATGSVKLASAGETVSLTLLRQSSSTWHAEDTATATLSTKGTFSATMSAPHADQYRVVATVAPTDSHKAGASAPFAVHSVGPKVIALTFDDGPWPSSTQAILAILAKNGIHATFFELGSQVNAQRARSKAVAEAGNPIGVHTWNHALMTKRSAKVNANDLRKTKNTIWRVTGSVPRWFRPPYGSTNKSIAGIAKGLGMGQVLWSVDTLDWKIRNKSSVSSRAIKGARNGAIVLMHDGGGPRKATVAAVPTVIKTLRARGYDFVTLDEMAALGYKVH